MPLCLAMPNAFYIYRKDEANDAQYEAPQNAPPGWNAVGELSVDEINALPLENALAGQSCDLRETQSMYEILSQIRGFIASVQQTINFPDVSFYLTPGWHAIVKSNQEFWGEYAVAFPNELFRATFGLPYNRLDSRLSGLDPMSFIAPHSCADRFAHLRAVHINSSLPACSELVAGTRAMRILSEFSYTPTSSAFSYSASADSENGTASSISEYAMSDLVFESANQS